MSYTCWVEYHEACPGGACTCTCHLAVSDKVRHEVEDAEADMLACIRACVEAFPQSADL